jgi:hypothetical protein
MSDISDFFDLSNNNQNEYENHWKDMPEYIQKSKKDSYCKIIFRFRNEKDLQEFSKLIGQKLNVKTKSAWYPYKSHYRDIQMEWIDET